MKHLLIFTLTICLYSFSHSQTPTDIYNSKNYEVLTKLDKESEKLTSDELFMVGYAFCMEANNLKAIEYYDRAIAKGFNNASIHYSKGVSLNYLTL